MMQGEWKDTPKREEEEEEEEERRGTYVDVTEKTPEKRKF